ncbi:hypothetical protein WJX72_004115 [[Myrmecia] bisecta]|uniref:Major facilitator superfamily (MFS) profile domain-containing protein n=1 Tax=[Myrmecia] bisecta TaxID=41462 RepID=A0AAW1Q8Y0_9CHLO
MEMHCIKVSRGQPVLKQAAQVPADANGNVEDSDTHSVTLHESTGTETVRPADKGELQQPAWYTPRRLMALFCLILFLVWMDVGVIASNGVNGSPRTKEHPQGSGIQGDFDLSYFEDGVLPAVFMVGLMIASVILTDLTAYFNAFRLIGVGMVVWFLGALGSGLSQGFWSLLVARVAVGAGEASIITLSFPFIDDVAPPASKALWFGVLAVFPSVGVAIGYVFGGLVAGAWGWRACFFMEAGLAIPVILLTLCAPAVTLRSSLSVVRAATGKVGWKERFGYSLRHLWGDLKILHQHPVFLYNNWGYVPQQAAIGAFTFWGPKAAKEMFTMPPDEVDVAIAAVTITTAIVGTIGGGVILDKIGSNIRNGMLINLWTSALALVSCQVAFLAVHSFAVFCLVFGLGLLFLFTSTAAAYAISMWSIPPPQRPASQAIMIVTMHLFGDVPSPPVVGAIQGAAHNWRLSLSIITATLVISVLLYVLGLVASGTALDYHVQEEEQTEGYVDLPRTQSEADRQPIMNA